MNTSGGSVNFRSGLLFGPNSLVAATKGRVKVASAPAGNGAATLRLAATSMEGHSNREQFVVDFSDNESTVAESLIAEVLAGEGEACADCSLAPQP